MITVIMPTYQPDSYIYEVLDSIYRQKDYSQFELIIVLNGDKEPFYNRLSQKLSEYSFRYSLLYTDVKGVSNARNYAIDNSKGDYIVFLDDDDIISPNYISNLCLLSDQNALVFANVKTFIDRINELSDDYLSQSFNNNCKRKRPTIFQSRSYYSTVCAKLIPKNIIKNVRFSLHHPVGEDCLFMAEISKNVKKNIFASEDTVYYRRVRPTSVSQSRKIEKERGMSFRAIIKYIKIWLQNPFSFNVKFMISRVLSAFVWWLRSIFKISY